MTKVVIDKGPPPPPPQPTISTSGTVDYTAGMSEVELDGGLTVNTVDLLEKATVVISGGYIVGDKLNVSVGRTGLSYSTSVSNNTLILTLTGTESAATYQEVLRVVSYSFSGADPTETGHDNNRTIHYQYETSGGTYSTVGASTVDVFNQAVCHLRGTRILTPTGEVPIESLKIGDVVVTRFGGLRPIKWIGRQVFHPASLARPAETLPVRMSVGALGSNLPARDLYVSPGHSLLIENTLVVAKTLINGITITQPARQQIIEYFQIDLGTHDCTIAEGTWSESFADGPNGTLLGLRGEFHNHDEFCALYPNHKRAEELVLCAPRPSGGPALARILAPTVALAASSITPGPLEGYVDQVSGGWHVDGWAHDTAHPDLPVDLAIFLGGRQIGTIIACDWRDDLEKVGKARGRCAFRLTLPRRLRQDEIKALRILRAADGAILPFSEAMLGVQSERQTA